MSIGLEVFQASVISAVIINMSCVQFCDRVLVVVSSLFP